MIRESKIEIKRSAVAESVFYYLRKEADHLVDVVADPLRADGESINNIKVFGERDL